MIGSVANNIVSNGENQLVIWGETQNKKRMHKLQQKSEAGTISKTKKAELCTREVAEALKAYSSHPISFGALNKAEITSNDNEKGKRWEVPQLDFVSALFLVGLKCTGMKKNNQNLYGASAEDKLEKLNKLEETNPKLKENDFYSYLKEYYTITAETKQKNPGKLEKEQNKKIKELTIAYSSSYNREDIQNNYVELIAIISKDTDKEINNGIIKDMFDITMRA